MKISEMTNEQAADLMVRLSAPVGNICDDEKITNMIKEYQATEEMPVVKVIGKFLPQIAACALKDHKNDLFEIVGALTFQTRDKAAKMRFIDTVKVIREAVEDEELVGFFTSFKRQNQKTAGESAQG